MRIFNFKYLSGILSRSHSTAAGGRILAVGLGSNVGDRVANIEGALSFLKEESDICIVDTSFLYETSPMYVQDQPRFINGACLISTSMAPQALINLFKRAEFSQGRVPTIQNGPRVVDLDILFDEDKVYNLSHVPGRELNIPHPRIQEREFVLRPLADIIPSFVHPVVKTSVESLLSQLGASEPPMRRILNFPTPRNSENCEAAIWPLGVKTYVMGTLNTTPDSFSDGGDHNVASTAEQYAISAVKDGANIIDVGGFSTRPGSTTITVGEELSRTVPFIRHLRTSSVGKPISIDTFRAKVAEAALDAGANCINDVYALTGPHLGIAGTRQEDIVVDESGLEVSDNGEMLKLAAKSKVPLILMHSRGAANQNKDYSQFGDDIMSAVRSELGLRVSRALKAGVRRWNIILDPGIGFSKTVGDNVALIRRHAHLSADEKSDASPIFALPRTPRLNLAGFPTLVGTSRKGYLGKIVKRESDPKGRDWATAAAVTSLIQQRADIVRVHSVREMMDVVLVADAIWRQ